MGKRSTAQPVYVGTIPIPDRPIPVILTSADLHPYLNRRDSHGRVLAGYTERRDGWAIYLDAARAEQHYLADLVHEIQHALYYLTDPKVSDFWEVEEQAVVRLTAGLTFLLTELDAKLPPLPANRDAIVRRAKNARRRAQISRRKEANGH